ncbi:PucR family transcriptional regulator [Nocardioides litoris]|uniref:PucR family transcriptional regulator n=1 Tax=Nocardioides litoris TaxID=1926648 RepID=UPI0011243E84|nr:helix-turn-helix domain-containing protein [Nocardioides litoris]
MAERQLQHLVDTLAERLGRSVVLDDPEVNLLAASRHYGDADEQRVRAVLQRDVGGPAIGHILGQGVARWTRPGTIPAREDLGMVQRLCHPIRWQGQLLGLLLVIDADGTLGEPEVEEVVRAGHEIGALLLGEQLGQDHRRREQEDAVADLVGPDPAARDAGTRALDRLGVLRHAAHVTVTALELDDRDSTLEATEATLGLRIATAGVARSRAGYAAGAVLGARGVLLQTWDRPPPPERLREQATELREAVGRVLGDHVRTVAGVGSVRPGLLEAHRAHDEALVALRAARRVPSSGGLALAAELGPLELLLRIPERELTRDLVPAPLRRLQERDPQGRLVETLRAYLDHAGATPATSEALHLHRTSLYYRLERIEELAGVDLADGRTRLLLHLGLQVLELLPDRLPD